MEEIYRKIFGRNIGNITEEEQEKLNQTTIAVAGTGGVGGAALMNLVRIGIGKFKIADPEAFAYSDINRQEGSGYAIVSSKKVEVLEGMAKAINPGVKIEVFPEGLKEENLERFLEGAALVIDGLDFFCLPIRKKMFDACRKKDLYILSCPIFGFGTSLAVFSPQGPAFEEIFGPIPQEMNAKFLINFGRTFFPVFPRYINLAAYIEAMNKNTPIPSFSTSCALSGAVTAAEAVFILLKRKKPVCMPLIRHYDLFDAKIKVLDIRKKKLNPIKKFILKSILARDKKLRAYKDLIDKL